MKAPETYTFIISRIYGSPVSWSVTAWRVYLGMGAAAVLITAMLVMSLLFLATFPRLQKIERERDDLLRQRDSLQQQVLSANQEAFEAREDRFVQAALKRAGATFEPYADLPVRNGEQEYVPPVGITSVTAKVERRSVEVVFRISEVVGAPDNLGGFLFAIFENKDRDPVTYKATPNVGLNEEGFPQAYKAGIRFPRVRRTVTYRRRVRLQNPSDYFTHITLYLFSLRGGLLVKDRFALEAGLFQSEGSGVRIQKLLSL